MEDAAIVPETLASARTGVFVGVSTSDYARSVSGPGDLDAYFATGISPSVAAGRISYFLNLTGPTMVVDTACSSAAVALHLACRSIRNGETDVALAGGVSLILSPYLSVALTQASMLAPDGRCKPFDARANGYVRSEGCGMLLLKPLFAALRDGDRVHGLIRGSAVNQDGASNGLTAPSGVAQQRVLREALADAGVAPGDVGYVETHGTGTALGDPIEFAALNSVLGQDSQSQNESVCYLGSAKANIGHTEPAAGVAGVIKALLVLKRGEIPPLLHFQKLNPHIDDAGSRLRLPREPRAWHEDSPRIAGVSSFGFSGTNAHVILEGFSPEEQPDESDEVDPVAERPLHLFVASARDERALREIARAWCEHPASAAESLADICYSAATGRAAFEHRLALAVVDRG